MAAQCDSLLSWLPDPCERKIWFRIFVQYNKKLTQAFVIINLLYNFEITYVNFFSRLNERLNERQSRIEANEIRKRKKCINYSNQTKGERDNQKKRYARIANEIRQKLNSTAGIYRQHCQKQTVTSVYVSKASGEKRHSWWRSRTCFSISTVCCVRYFFL